MKCYLAYYKSRKNLIDRAIMRWTRGNYSHVELVIEKEELYYCYSASPRDGGIRMKQIDLTDGKWDLVQIPKRYQISLIKAYQVLKGKKYDWLGILGFVIPTQASKNRWFCSEFCAHVLGLKEPWRYSPSDLYQITKRYIEIQTTKE